MKLKRKTFLQLCGAGLGGFVAGRFSVGSKTKVSRIGLAELPEFDPVNPSRFWAAVRRGYDFEKDLVYLNSGGLGPSPVAVRQYTARMAAEMESKVETGHSRLGEIRQEVAEFLGCKETEVAFVRNATEGNSIVAGGLALEPGDEVIFESHAHPGGSFPWLLQARRRGVVVRLFDPDPASAEGNLERIEALMGPRTRALQVSHVTAPTGLRFPVPEIAALCRKRGVWFHVDGAQTTGMLPLDFKQMGCDSYASSGHKWLGAPRETGLLIVKEDKLDSVSPIVAGAYTGEVESLPGEFRFNPTAERYEHGTRDIARIEGLAAAMRWQNAIGRDRIEAHGRRLVAQLRAGLSELPEVEILSPENPTLSSAMLTFRSPRMGYRDLFGNLFNQHRMRCRPVSEQGLDAVRVSCHLFNSTGQIDRLVAAIEKELNAV